MIKTSKQLALWMAVISAIVAASQAIPESLPGWLAGYVRWAGVALGAGLAAYTALSRSVTLPAERELGDKLVMRGPIG